MHFKDQLVVRAKLKVAIREAKTTLEAIKGPGGEIIPERLKCRLMDVTELFCDIVEYIHVADGGKPSPPIVEEP